MSIPYKNKRNFPVNFAGRKKIYHVPPGKIEKILESDTETQVFKEIISKDLSRVNETPERNE